VHGVKGLINLFGIESPGLTSALALGALVADGVPAAAWAPEAPCEHSPGRAADGV